MLLKTCSKCKRFIKLSQSYCKTCKSLDNKNYDRYKRDDDSTQFYSSKRWQVLRRLVLNKYNYIDVMEYYKNGRIARAECVHHIEELKDNKAKAHDLTNLIPLTNSNHSKVHSIYKQSEEQKKELQKELIKYIKKYNKDFNR